MAKFIINVNINIKRQTYQYNMKINIRDCTYYNDSCNFEKSSRVIKYAYGKTFCNFIFKLHKGSLRV